MDIGYIKQLLQLILEELDKGEEKKHGHTNASTPSDDTIRDRILEVARSQIGKPYVWGGDGPDKFDCSGFTQWVYKQVGLIPKTNPDTNSTGQRTWGQETKVPQKGDLICYDGHVAIYVDPYKRIHASSTAGKVIEGPMTDRKVLCYRSLIGV